MKTLYLIISLILSPVFIVSAQSLRTCGTDEYQGQLLQQIPGYQKQLDDAKQQVKEYLNSHPSFRTRQVINIPVVFHVLYNDSLQDIPDSVIFEQMNVLNNDHNRLNADTVNTPAVFTSCAASTGIHFSLAAQDPNGLPTSGIRHVYTQNLSFHYINSPKLTSAGGDDAWPNTQYLNIWTCNYVGATIALSTFPVANPSIYDGIVVSYQYVGGPNAPGIGAPWNLGRVLTHETGHWLGLNHFADNCDTTGTGYCNPPQQSMPVNCPSFPQITCNNGPNGDMFMNYMQGVDDSCMNLFNLDQSAIMNAILNTIRSSLLTSPGVGINETNPLPDFRVFPNPFNEQLNIRNDQSGSIELTIYDLTGRAIVQKIFTNAVTIDTKEISSGFYLLELIIDGKRTVRKVVKE